MIYREWPFGTRKRVKVSRQVRTKDTQLILAEELWTYEGFVLMYQDRIRKVTDGEVVTIEFAPGGPFGGFWEIVKEG